MNNTLKFYEKKIFGATQIRPSDNAAARALQFIQAVAVTGSHLRTLKDLGFTILLNKTNYETVTI